MGLYALIWRWRWILLLALLIIAPPSEMLLQLSLARFGIGWIPLLVEGPLLIALIIIGVRRENRRSRPVPPRLPGHQIDEIGLTQTPAVLDLEARLAA